MATLEPSRRDCTTNFFPRTSSGPSDCLAIPGSWNWRRSSLATRTPPRHSTSHAALSEGLEWTSKISQYELPYLWERIIATFEAYWNDEEFEPYTRDAHRRLAAAIERERAGSGARDGSVPAFDLRPFPFQEEILDILA